MVNKITFTNYKIFNSEQCIELAPMTILIGKNSSGKSAFAKLPTLIAGSLSGSFNEPFRWENEGILLGNSYLDLNHEKDTTGDFEFKLELENKIFLHIYIIFGENQLTVRSWNYNNEFKAQYHFKEKLYSINDSTRLYDCKFKGFLLESIVDFEGEIPSLTDFSFEFDYVCSYRVEPKDIKEDQPKEKNIKKIGIDGKHAYEILINDYIYSDGQLLNKVSNWYKEVFENWEVNIDRDTQRNKFYFELKRELKRETPRLFTTSLDNVGQGMSQILPLITKSFIEEEKPSLTIIEEPELHLHPSAHGNLAERFAESLIDANKRYLIETHSENFILRLRRLIAESKYPYFTEQNLKIYYVDYEEDLNESFLRDIKIDSFGEVYDWPDGIFSDSFDEVFAIRKAQKLKKDVS
ncbi:putative ATPase [Arcicella rosea]|uniref:AAA family ATPase n=1 Tax=Arcicella rosea TaxID=502909 RepID=UPI00345C77A7